MFNTSTNKKLYYINLQSNYINKDNSFSKLICYFFCYIALFSWVYLHLLYMYGVNIYGLSAPVTTLEAQILFTHLLTLF